MENTIEVKIERLKRNVDSSYTTSTSEPQKTCHAYRNDPSLNLLPQFHGPIRPSGSFCIRTTGFTIPGTAAEASTADQIMVSGAVR